ncbi:hypothetical protein O0I16_10795 [Staphylococcus pseudintermedius]|uniref:hypothetical protein n=1 Tax=Staphylococcus pseudintermedius TaxID=283734 RepID=UPI00143FAF85|nr:hypothetical protein [Staphylococcus pseudintermedius]EGQ3717860.1 hypothetical protein [Staphylococcus pseudintermedius]EGQ4407682.1 hypothetical protein [Staphylococcus pseudintermedius]MDE9985320.1 hypothetical protein [Staphylococcus pseudintermedius]MDE9987673.1 hypothetical protein [Staphylococcus pseudintermedius]MDE9999685.1 hypothetical protein [Staphylococcus pseudintermedius]
MKKILIGIALSVLVLSACSNDKQESNSTDNTKQESSSAKGLEQSNVNEEHLKEFTESLYEADKREDVQHLDIANDNVKTIINRQFQGANFENSDRYDQTASNVRLFKSVDDKSRYIVTLETKARDKKEKRMTWLQKTVQLKLKNGKINDFAEIGEKQIFNEQD